MIQTQIFAITNQKGGVGKTTTSINLAASLAATKRNVLLIDMDPQGNATMGSGIDKREIEHSITEVLLDNFDINNAVVTLDAGYDVLPANSDLTAVEVGLLQKPKREFFLRQELQGLNKNYHYTIIDCPPTLNMLTVNALVAATGVIIPMQCEYFALEGLSDLLNTIDGLRKNLNPKLQIEGVLRTMYDPRNRLTSDVSKQLLEFFGDKVYRSVIPRNVRLAEAPSFGLPCMLYDRRSQGASAYVALAGEIIRRHQAQQVEQPKLAEAS
jgi:chromosome partitioning protein